MVICKSSLEKTRSGSFEAADTSIHSDGVVYLRKDGRFVGPFGAELHSPRVGEHFLGMALAIAEIPGLNARNREIATITTGAKFNAAYELYAHRTLAEKHGVLVKEYETILTGHRPETLDEEGKALYDMAYEFMHGSGPLSQATWTNGVRLLTRDGAIAVVQYIAFYSYVCTILNGFDCRILSPEE
ncbi:hypothetical protein AOQ84DRAFT_286603 [Glonium stellatum]|uniref:Carboxymuconolactone decarboxylase-like domain-containing protein n=1 Tax=Glonium stellatum TaxID=574774 RepID=A0A8E2JW61_9PEZI|nr:hypothetical protein AOQ84DRAFT_286603 [Glonium stellatum]